MEAYRFDFIKLKQGEKSIAKYEVEFLRLSRYAQGMVATEQDQFLRFENGLWFNHKV